MKPDRALLKDKAPFAKVEAPCPYFGTCGGCTLQDLSYSDQVVLKTQRLLKILGTLDPTLTVEVVPLEDPWRYRNKAELTFSDARPSSAAEDSSVAAREVPSGAASPRSGMVLGYHAARSFWRIVDLDDCLLLPESMSRVFRDARSLAQASGQPAYNPRTHQGFFRYLTIRASHATGKLLVSCMTTQGEREVIDALAEELMRRHPDIVGVYWGINGKVADVAIADELLLIRGSPYLEDRLGPFSLKLHPSNFLQPNPVQAERLYARLMALVSDVPSETAWDLYCGIGLVAFYLSAKYRTVYGIDLDERNLELARLNAQDNGIHNVQFRAGRAEEVLTDKRFWLLEAKPEIVVVDPPRSGLHDRVIAALLAARPKQVVYISCNAQAMVRDLQPLLRGFPRYRICQVSAFDLFPHTNHLEVLTLLERAS